jgi:hypothetical protein
VRDAEFVLLLLLGLDALLYELVVFLLDSLCGGLLLEENFVIALFLSGDLFG